MSHNNAKYNFHDHGAVTVAIKIQNDKRIACLLSDFIAIREVKLVIITKSQAYIYAFYRSAIFRLFCRAVPISRTGRKGGNALMHLPKANRNGRNKKNEIEKSMLILAYAL